MKRKNDGVFLLEAQQWSEEKDKLKSKRNSAAKVCAYINSMYGTSVNEKMVRKKYTQAILLLHVLDKEGDRFLVVLLIWHCLLLWYHINKCQMQR